jgi:hypothetical protein
VSLGWHLAELNIGRFAAPLDSPGLKDFVDNLDRINALAEAAPGFVWRLTGEGNNATDIRPFEDDPMMAVNLSVWSDLAALGAYVYRSDHVAIMRRRREFFEVPTEAFMALWWVPAGHIPTIAEAIERLQHLREHGPSPFAFSFREPFAPPSGDIGVEPVLDECA